MSVAVLGAGAFGTALAIAVSQNGPVTLWARDPKAAEAMRAHRENATRLPGRPLPDSVTVTADIAETTGHDTVLLAIPLQKLRGFLSAHGAALEAQTLVACCKGMELATGLGPVSVIADCLPRARAAILTGPSFAVDIAAGLPTALTLACAQPETGALLQERLSTRALRLYRTTDVTGAELGGALKNVIAIACGAAIGAGQGESARAALMTRGYAEMQRLAVALGARAETLAGLSGFGDLALTCASEKSRNYRLGLSLGRGTDFDRATTVEGADTALAVRELARRQGVDLPITSAVAGLVEKRLDVADAISALLSRPLKEE
ncbi:NAD(P)H-dependent glycerol-3-phosphate dehydrogenase [Sulfitobacter sp. D35]|uniref:NAD(P)H-dependent glycerol-3-phosphate dehydrogenase n=1 Tax=Sulfitobacter sp. D35 TaxID=3083252 RepID=UPI00296E294D|nr:NAD(P)H-dependent glycerol-3-phosphate dehydrogenase [Sulfitobacter sp. D35]MDW4498107.1 NAD(P)H-dependent glycerol-3-phosphate dehydrogenase [Sulfitobacter sp. D35]